MPTRSLALLEIEAWASSMFVPIPAIAGGPPT
jgi:hypothetical protein